MCKRVRGIKRTLTDVWWCENGLKEENGHTNTVQPDDERGDERLAISKRSQITIDATAVGACMAYWSETTNRVNAGTRPRIVDQLDHTDASIAQ